MNILYSAFACDPYKGSEAYCGWSWPYIMNEINKEDKIYVLTRKENKKNIEKFLKENKDINIKFIYCDIPDKINFYNKTGKLYFLYYIMWQKKAYKYIKRQKNIKFDIIHHITLGDFRIIGKLWKIKDAKFIFGPVGGAQTTPKCLEEYSKENKGKEIKRKIINNLVKFNPFYIRAINKCYKIYCANEETSLFIEEIVKNKNKIEILTENGVSKDYLTKINFEKSINKDKITILWAGRMIYRKGLKLLLEIIKTVKTNKKIELCLVGSGKQEQELKKYVKENNLENIVKFKGKCKYIEMIEEYKKADIFVFPSIRETTGTVLFEAMSNYLPIISFNQNGAKRLVDKETGILIDINNIEQIKKDFKDAIELLVLNDEERIKMGKKAREKIENEYTWENKCKYVLKEYKFLEDK